MPNTLFAKANTKGIVFWGSAFFADIFIFRFFMMTPHKGEYINYLPISIMLTGCYYHPPQKSLLNQKFIFIQGQWIFHVGEGIVYHPLKLQY